MGEGHGTLESDAWHRRALPALFDLGLGTEQANAQALVGGPYSGSYRVSEFLGRQDFTA